MHRCHDILRETTGFQEVPKVVCRLLLKWLGFSPTKKVKTSSPSLPQNSRNNGKNPAKLGLLGTEDILNEVLANTHQEVDKTINAEVKRDFSEWSDSGLLVTL